MLDSAGDTQCDVQVRRDGNTGLADLELARVVVGVHSCTGSTNSSAHDVGQWLDNVGEALRATHATTTGDHDVGLGQVRAVTLLCRSEGGDGDSGRASARQLYLLDVASGSLRLRIQGARSQGEDRGCASGGSGNGVSATEDADLSGLLGGDAAGVVQNTGSNTGAYAACNLVARCGSGDDNRNLQLCCQAGQRVDLRGNQQGLCLIGLCGVDGLCAGLGQCALQLLGGAGSANNNGADGAEHACSGDQLDGGVLQLTLTVLNQY